MASLSRTALRRLLPKGLAWQLTGQADAVMAGLADSIETVRAFISEAQLEAIPATATETLREWHTALGLEFDPGQTESQQRERVVSYHTSIGGSSLDYLNGQLQKQFPLVVASELPEGGPFDFTASVTGVVNTLREYNRLQGMVRRIFPLHIDITYNVQILASLDTAYTGIAMCGRAITGRITA
jgi:hypothetical protein